MEFTYRKFPGSHLVSGFGIKHGLEILPWGPWYILPTWAFGFLLIGKRPRTEHYRASTAQDPGECMQGQARGQCQPDK